MTKAQRKFIERIGAAGTMVARDIPPLTRMALIGNGVIANILPRTKLLFSREYIDRESIIYQLTPLGKQIRAEQVLT